MNAFYIFPASAKKSLFEPVLDAPAAREAHRARSSASRRSCRARRPRGRGLRTMGFLDALLGRRKVKGPAPDRLFAITTAYVDARDRAGSRRAARRRSSSSRSRPATSSDRHRHGGGPERHRRRERLDGRDPDDSFGYRWMIVHDPDVEDLAVGINAVSDALAVGGYGERAAVRGLRLQGRGRSADLLHLQLQARHLVPVRAGARRQAARRPSASCRSRRRSGSDLPDRARARALVPAVGDPDLKGRGSGWEACLARAESRRARRGALHGRTRRTDVHRHQGEGLEAARHGGGPGRDPRLQLPEAARAAAERQEGHRRRRDRQEAPADAVREARAAGRQARHAGPPGARRRATRTSPASRWSARTSPRPSCRGSTRRSPSSRPSSSS